MSEVVQRSHRKSLQTGEEQMEGRRKRNSHGRGAGNRLTNLRFADDALLIARSKAEIQEMVEDVATETRTGSQITHGKNVGDHKRSPSQQKLS